MSGISLMKRASKFSMEQLLAKWPATQSVSVVCGSGNNAGDGYLLAKLLHDRQISVEIIQVADSSRLKGDALSAFESVVSAGLTIKHDLDITGEIIVDALLGTGVVGEIRSGYQDAIDCINQSNRPTLSLDLPSGINPESGGLLTEHPVRADVTVSFVGRKLAVSTGKACSFAGEVAFSDLGIPEEAYGGLGIPILPLTEEERHLPPRSRGSFKGDFGHVLIVAGNAGMGGAALLSAEACLRTGAGLVTLVTHSDHAAALLSRRPELMVIGTPIGEVDPQCVSKATVVALGPGLGQDDWAKRAFHSTLDQVDQPLVLDADGLNLITKNRKKLTDEVVLTPHPGEAGRLLGVSTAEVEADRLRAVCDIALQFQATVLLKGAGTLIADQDGPLGICDVSEPALSTGGSGDVLTGVIASVAAQTLDIWQATRIGAYLHAQAGIRARTNKPNRAVIASDLIDALHPWG